MSHMVLASEKKDEKIQAVCNSLTTKSRCDSLESTASVTLSTQNPTGSWGHTKELSS